MQVKFRKYSLLIVDAILIFISYFIAFELRFDFFIPEYLQVIRDNTILLNIILTILPFSYFGLYRSLWQYISVDELLNLFISVLIQTSLFYASNALFRLGIPRTVIILNAILVIFLTGGLRFSYRMFRRYMIQHSKSGSVNLERIMVVGSIEDSSVIVKELKKSNIFLPVVVLDDIKWIENSTVEGVPVRYGIENLAYFASEYNVNKIIISTVSLSHKMKVQIIALAKESGCKVLTIPGISEIVDNKITISNIREVEIEDLLGREENTLDNDSIQKYICEKVVLVTGAGGSIGSEIVHQIASFNPKLLLLLDIYENNVYELEQRLKIQFPNLKQKVLIASIRDQNRLKDIFTEYRPHIVFHAAAHKHVPLMEDNPDEAIKNNIFGTYNLVEESHESSVEKFIMISSDKAVNPTNIMGASKRIAELIVLAYSKQSTTIFSSVRFGNVLGSNGSVIPLFKMQIKNGGPVTVTDPKMTRYFMTIKEAAGLVLQAGAIANKGELFVLDMGEPVKILDLAEQLIELSGYEPYKDIDIKFIGLRKGEKLFEELHLAEDGVVKTTKSKIYIANPTTVERIDIISDLEQLRNFTNIDDKIAWIHKYVPSYGMKNV